MRRLLSIICMGLFQRQLAHSASYFESLSSPWNFQAADNTGESSFLSPSRLRRTLFCRPKFLQGKRTCCFPELPHHAHTFVYIFLITPSPIIHTHTAEKALFLEEANDVYGYDGLLDEIRSKDTPHLLNQAYLDWTGSGVYRASQVDAMANDLKHHLYGNTHR